MSKRVKVDDNIVREVASSKAGVQQPYSADQVLKLFMDQYPYQDIPTLNELDLIMSLLNLYGHNLNNLTHTFNIIQSRRNPRQNVEYKSNQGWETLGKLGKTFLTVLDVPRKAIASGVAQLRGDNDPAYDWLRIFNTLEVTNPTPIAGRQFAQANPLTSFAIDVAAPTGLYTIGAKSLQGLTNAYNLAFRLTSVIGPQKTKALLLIATGTFPLNTGYEVTTKLVPKTKTNYGVSVTGGTSKPGKATSLTGSKSASSGRWASTNHSVTGNYVNSSGSSIPYIGTETGLSVFPITNIPGSIIPGLPQLVIPAIAKPEQSLQEWSIIQEEPINYTDSDIINWLIKNKGFLEGDTVDMPDGRVIKYTRGDGGLGRSYGLGIEKKYDWHGSDAKQQPNIPSQTKITSGGNKGVRKVSGKEDLSVYRDSTNYFPYLIK